MFDVTVNVEVEDPPEAKVKLVGFCERVRPLGELPSLSVTVPVNPLILVTVAADTLEVPTGTLRSVGVAEMVKSVTRTVTLTTWVKEPDVPVTVTV